MMFSVLNRYLIKRVITGIALAFLIVTSIIMLVDFVEGSRNIDPEDNIGPGALMVLTVLKAPTLIEQTVPFVILFGVMGTLYNLNRRSELIVLRASGLSAWRFLSPAIAVTAVFGIIWALAFNPLASKAMDTHDLLFQKYSGIETPTHDQSLWLREGNDISQTVIYAKSADIFEHRLIKTTFYIFNFDSSGTAIFERRLDAKEAQLVTQGYWQLTDVIENAEGELTKKQAAISLPTSITIEDIRNTTEKKTTIPFWEIWGSIKKTEKAGFSARGLRMRLNKLLALPILLIAMTVIAAGVSMHLSREGGALRLLITGCTLGFAVYFADNIVHAFGEAAILPIILATWAITLFVLLCGIGYLAKVEDG